MAAKAWILPIATLALGLLAATGSSAQTPAGYPATSGGSAAFYSPREEARQARLVRYWLKRERKMARKALRQQEKEFAREAKALQRGEKRFESSSRGLPRRLAWAQDSVRRTRFGEDPTVSGYLDLVDQQEASAQQLAALGNFLAQGGLLREALEYYRVAVRLEKTDPLLWINIGTLHRQLGESRPALDAYNRAIRLDRNAAAAHYNRGAILDEQGKYNQAIQAYKLALTLDPTLGDPNVNPQSANNERLMAVRLMLYGEQSGSLGLPLSKVPGSDLDDKPEQER